MMRFLRLPIALAFGWALAGSLSAQSFPFQLVILDQNQNATVVTDAATLNLAANALGSKVTITINATYEGSNTMTLGAPLLVGSPAFSVGKLSATVLNSGNLTALNVNFIPTSSAQAQAQLSIPFIETGPTGLTVSQGSITFALVGSAPQFVVSYYLQGFQNVMPLADGGTLTFQPTLVSTSAGAVVQVQNNGSAAGLINSIQVSGAAFQTTSVPLLPGTLGAGGVLQVGIVYTPTQAGTDTGKLTITFPDHSVTVTLMGTGTAPIYTYQLVVNGQASDITPNQTLTFSSGPTTLEAFTITVQNTGTGTGVIGGTSLSGQGYAIVDAPAAGVTLPPGGIASYNLAFVPPYVGTFPGRLRIGNDVFTLSGTGTGAQLGYSFTIASTTTGVSPGGTVPFPSVQVGQSESGVFTVQNSGNTASTTVVAIFIGAAVSPFAITGLPSVPVTLAPGASASFTITFTPAVVGLNTATLQIDSANFTLAGSGNPLPALPNFTLSGGGGVTAPLQQPAIGVTLQSPYSTAVTGTLALTQNPQGFSPDPSVQFSTGGTTVNFTIPANSTQAIFPNNSTSIRMQTGSVANTITVTPSFATGGLNLTPGNPATLQFTVPAGPPQLIDVVIAQTTSTGFTLQVAGLATTRSLTTLTFTFTPETGYNLAATKVSVDVSSVATNWFQSLSSASFGGQFLIAAPFSLTSITSSGAASALPPLLGIQSVSVTATNAQGTSNAVTAQFQ